MSNPNAGPASLEWMPANGLARAFAAVCEHHWLGLVSREQFHALHSQFQCFDRSGRAWTLGAQTARWQRWQERPPGWVADVPPDVLGVPLGGSDLTLFLALAAQEKKKSCPLCLSRAAEEQEYCNACGCPLGNEGDNE